MNLRNFLLKRLKQLREPQFDEVLFRLESTYPTVRGQVDAPGRALPQRAINLILFVEQNPDGLGLLCDQLDPPFTLPGSAIVELAAVLNQAAIPEEAVRRVFHAYLKTLGEQASWEAPDFNTQALWDCLFDYLLDTSWMKTSGQHHLINFIARLAPTVKFAEQRQNLQAWVRKTAADLGIVPPGTSGENGLGQQSQTYLLIAVSPEGGFYTLRAWFSDSPEIFDDICEKTLGPNLDDLPKELKEVLNNSKVTGTCLRGNPPILEFFLPANLLNRDLDEWTPPEEKRPLSTQYALVVRAGERLWGKYWLPDWGRTWKDCRQTLPEKASKRRVAWLSCSRESRCGKYLRKKRWVVGLCFVPDAECFETLLDSGVGILLWSRIKLVPAAQERLKRQLARQVIETLPEWLHRRRCEHWENEEPADPLSLLWDDPLRLPDNYQLMDTHPDS